MRKKNFFLLLVTLCLCIFAQAQMLSDNVFITIEQPKLIRNIRV